MLEQIQGLEATAHRLAAERDEARVRVAQLTEERNAAWNRADRAEALCNVLQTRDANRGLALRDLARQLAETQRALDAATRPAQPPAEPEPAPPAPRVFDTPRRPVRRKSWRRPPRRH